MGVSTNGIIAWGIVFEEGYEFPWGCDGEDGLSEWWLDVQEYKHPFEIYTDDGDYVDGVVDGDPRIDEYYQHYFDWEKANPCPVGLENVCSGDYPIYALVIPELTRECRRGFPSFFDPKELVVTEEQKSSFLAFLKDCGIEYEDEPGWFLGSYWG